MNWKKFVAAVHYVCNKADDPSVLGAVKLNKVLWYADVLHYMSTGASITGEQYVKRQHGPVPRHVLGALDQLVDAGKIARGKVDHFGFVKNEFIPIEEPDLSVFDSAEVAILDEAFEHVCLNHTARSISEETHRVIWSLAEMGEAIPYETVFASAESEVNEDDIAHAQALITARLGIHPVH